MVKLFFFFIRLQDINRQYLVGGEGIVFDDVGSNINHIVIISLLVSICPLPKLRARLFVIHSICTATGLSSTRTEGPWLMSVGDLVTVLPLSKNAFPHKTDLIPPHFTLKIYLIKIRLNIITNSSIFISADVCIRDFFICLLCISISHLGSVFSQNS